MNKFKFIAEEKLQKPLITDLPWPESEIGRRIRIMRGEHANAPAIVRKINIHPEFKFELEILYNEIFADNHQRVNENETYFMNEEEYREALNHYRRRSEHAYE